MSIQIFYFFFDWVVCFFVIELYELFVYFGDESFVIQTICKCFLPFCRLFFILCMVCFAVEKLMSLIIMSCLVFKTLSHFQFSFVYGVRVNF